MRVLKLIAPALVAFSFVPVAAESASAAPDPTGIWLNDTGRGAVEIKNCGNALCGNVVWVKAASDSKGCGKQVIGGVAPVGGGRWDNGWIYSPERGRKYDVELTPLKNGTLRVTGYAGVKFLSKTMIWTRAPQDLQLCGQTEAKAETAAPVKSDAAGKSIASAAPSESASATASSEKPSSGAAEVSAPKSTPVDADNSREAAKLAPASPLQDASADTPNDEAAPANDDRAAGLGNALGNLKLGNLSLDKVLTRTGSGKCKLNTPWLKVQFDCER